MVLPAPFWPIRPTISPGATLRLTWSTALIPPKRRVTATSSNAGPAPIGGSSGRVSGPVPFPPLAPSLAPAAATDSARNTARSRSGRFSSSSAGPENCTRPRSMK